MPSTTLYLAPTYSSARHKDSMKAPTAPKPEIALARSSNQ